MRWSYRLSVRFEAEKKRYSIAVKQAVLLYERSNLAGERELEYFPFNRKKYWKGDDGPLRMDIRDDSKTVELWLTRLERDDSFLRESLKPLYRQYKAQNYMVAVFYSGEEDLYQQTRDLLLYNRRRVAEKQVQEQGQQAMVL